MVYLLRVRAMRKVRMQPMSHKEQGLALRRIEGQIRGIQKMILDNRYCVDILTQLNSAVGALVRVQDHIFHKYLKGCVARALKGKSATLKNQKINEVIDLMKRFRKNI